jgi:hypothetical protein
VEWDMAKIFKGVFETGMWWELVFYLVGKGMENYFVNGLPYLISRHLLKHQAPPFFCQESELEERGGVPSAQKNSQEYWVGQIP